MNCERAQEALSAYLDGELDEPVARSVREHLDGCQTCAAEWVSLRAVAQLYREWPEPAVPADLRARVQSAIQKDLSERDEILDMFRDVNRRRVSPSWLSWLMGPRLATVGGAAALIVVAFWAHRLFIEQNNPADNQLSVALKAKDMAENTGAEPATSKMAEAGPRVAMSGEAPFDDETPDAQSASYFYNYNDDHFTIENDWLVSNQIQVQTIDSLEATGGAETAGRALEAPAAKPKSRAQVMTQIAYAKKAEQQIKNTWNMASLIRTDEAPLYQSNTYAPYTDHDTDTPHRPDGLAHVLRQPTEPPREGMVHNAAPRPEEWEERGAFPIDSLAERAAFARAQEAMARNRPRVAPQYFFGTTAAAPPTGEPRRELPPSDERKSDRLTDSPALMRLREDADPNQAALPSTRPPLGGGASDPIEPETSSAESTQKMAASRPEPLAQARTQANERGEDTQAFRFRSNESESIPLPAVASAGAPKGPGATDDLGSGALTNTLAKTSVSVELEAQTGPKGTSATEPIPTVSGRRMIEAQPEKSFRIAGGPRPTRGTVNPVIMTRPDGEIETAHSIRFDDGEDGMTTITLRLDPASAPIQGEIHFSFEPMAPRQKRQPVAQEPENVIKAEYVGTGARANSDDGAHLFRIATDKISRDRPMRLILTVPTSKLKTSE